MPMVMIPETVELLLRSQSIGFLFIPGHPIHFGGRGGGLSQTVDALEKRDSFDYSHYINVNGAVVRLAIRLSLLMMG